MYINEHVRSATNASRFNRSTTEVAHGRIEKFRSLSLSKRHKKSNALMCSIQQRLKPSSNPSMTSLLFDESKR
jgi:hypothetical protein